MTVSRSSFVWFGILLVAAITGVIALVVLDPPASESSENPSLAIERDVPSEDLRTLLSFENPASVREMRVSLDGQRIVLTRSSDDATQWLVELNSGEAAGQTAPARSEKVEGILVELQEVISEGGIVRDVPTDDRTEFGLNDDDKISVDLVFEDDSMKSLTIGDVDFQGVHAYATNDTLPETELALVPVSVRSLLLIDQESIQQGTGEDRVEE